MKLKVILENQKNKYKINFYGYSPYVVKMSDEEIRRIKPQHTLYKHAHSARQAITFAVRELSQSTRKMPTAIYNDFEIRAFLDVPTDFRLSNHYRALKGV